MNGAAMDQVFQSQNKNSSHQNPGYHLGMNPTCHQQISHPQYSKTMSYSSDHYVVHHSTDFLQNIERNYDSEFRSNVNISDETFHRSTWYRPNLTQLREPMELPVPQFQIDENYVGVLPPTKTHNAVQISKDLDLDTRINLLIKSKALSGMHPIFSELSETEDFSHSSDDSSVDFPVTKSKQHREKPPFEEEVSFYKQVDDPETPLSNPPSPFLSRATYLFWFNKGIELKKQAKAQEQALLEQATKKLLCNSTAKNNRSENSKQGPNLLFQALLDEIGKEIKEAVKKEFIKEMIESTAFSSLEDWWEKEKGLTETKSILERQVVSSGEDSGGLRDIECNKSHSVGSPLGNTETGQQVQQSVSPKSPPPLTNVNQKANEKSIVIKNQSFIGITPKTTIVQYSSSEESDSEKKVVNEQNGLLQNRKCENKPIVSDFTCNENMSVDQELKKVQTNLTKSDDPKKYCHLTKSKIKKKNILSAGNPIFSPLIDQNSSKATAISADLLKGHTPIEETATFCSTGINNGNSRDLNKKCKNLSSASNYSKPGKPEEEDKPFQNQKSSLHKDCL